MPALKRGDARAGTSGLAGKQPELGSAAPTWERWRLAGVIRGKAFPHPLAAGTAALPEWQPSSGGFWLLVKDIIPNNSDGEIKKWMRNESRIHSPPPNQISVSAFPAPEHQHAAQHAQAGKRQRGGFGDGINVLLIYFFGNG